jgi:hypothetical protein
MEVLKVRRDSTVRMDSGREFQRPYAGWVFLTLPTHSLSPTLAVTLCPVEDPGLVLALDWGMRCNVQDTVYFIATQTGSVVWVENGSALSAHNNPRPVPI